MEYSFKDLTKDMLTEVLEMVKSTKNFTVEQAPDYIKQLLAYELISNYISIVICVLFIIASIIIPFYFNHFAVNLFCGVAIFLFFVGSILNIDNIIKIKVAPKVFIVDYISNLLNPKPKE